jgi:hypothetical protein
VTAEPQPDLTGEQERAEEAATGGILIRAVALDLDTSDDDLEPGVDAGDARDDDDEMVEDQDAA